jgi:polyribonucleotide nucleotidyltransferase
LAENRRRMKKKLDELNKKIKEDPSIIEEIKIAPEVWKEIIGQMEKSKNDYY